MSKIVDTMIFNMGEDKYRKWRKETGRKGGLARQRDGGKPKGFAWASIHRDLDDPSHPINAGSKGGVKSKRR